MKLTLGFSPCPNDTFIFDALVNKKIDTGGLEFEVLLEDVETLNQWALQGKLDITKLSFPAFFESPDNYILLNAGSALGKGVGPLLVSKQEDDYRDGGQSAVNHASIALPGSHTTANLLFSFAYPEAVNKKFMLFSAIENAVLNGETSLGVLIHENRFTYHQRGLQKVTDLGEYWENKMKVPIPLGGIAIKREMGKETSLLVDKLIRASLDHAFSEYPLITGYVKQHSQAMSEEIMRRHIDLYVNEYSLALGTDGKKAIKILNQVFNRVTGSKSTRDEKELFI
jgi:1,4-dihydroxy-6-naphthoate synthase